MKLGQFQQKDKIFHGIIDGKAVYPIKGNIFGNFKRSSKGISLDKIKFLPPTFPGKIVAVGLNYIDHAKELGMTIPSNPILFLKPSSSAAGHLANIIYPVSSKRVDYEAELGVVIKREAYKIKRQEVNSYILGYTCANDVTARDLQKSDGQWTRAKSFNTFCPFGPWIFIPEKGFNPNHLQIQARVNDRIKQDSNTNNFIFPVHHLIEFISAVMPLFPGDLVITGTPKGIGPIKPGDKIDIIIEEIGQLRNFCIKEN
ncbi:MAG: fumarylacetoacetate hydrolase family protein [Spirochaetes bacterium]|nr:fumarylacetoacetate hydrolase family protein [Spirochaetota bacterium]